MLSGLFQEAQTENESQREPPNCPILCEGEIRPNVRWRRIRNGGTEPMNGIQHGMQEVNVQNQDVAAWLEEAVPRLVRELVPERILLFGSWARKTATRRSDIDVCVIWNTDRSPLERIGRVLELLSDAPRPVEPVVYTPEEWERMRDHVPFVRRIDKEGKVLYERRAVVEGREGAWGSGGVGE